VSFLRGSGLRRMPGLLHRLAVRFRRIVKRRRSYRGSFVNVVDAFNLPPVPDVIDLPPAANDANVECLQCLMVVPKEDSKGAACGHLFCGGCLRTYALRQNFICSPVTCPAPGCNTIFRKEEVWDIVGNEAYQRKQLVIDEEAARVAQKELDESAANSLHARRHFNCQLCLEEVAKKDAMQLDCGHWHCQDCLHALLRSKISEGQVSENDLACPIPGCASPLSDVQVQAITGQTAMWERFLEFRARNWKPRTLEGCMAMCPTPDCERFEVRRGVLFAECPRCRVSFCVKCSGAAHEGMSCDEYKAWRRERDSEERLFEELMQKEAWRRCPKCGMPSERESGCNFMRCPSASCNHRTTWCYVCGKEVTNLDHILHYPQGPYRNRCFGQ